MTFSSSNPLIIDADGDSTIAGLTMNGSKSGPVPGADGTGFSIVAIPAPAGLQTLLQAKYGDLVVVTNKGVSGTSATDWLNGVNGVANPWSTEINNTPASIVIFGVGINDEVGTLPTSYSQIIQIAQASDKQFIAQTPNAVNASWATNIIDMKAAMERVLAVVKNVTLIDFSAKTKASDTWNDDLSYSEVFNEWSGIHPNQAGYDLMANAMFEVVDPLVGSLVGYPAGTLTATTQVPGHLLLFWTISNAEWAAINILDSERKGYWNGQAVAGESYVTGQGTAGEAFLSLPAGDYVLEFYGFWNGAWRVLELQTVTVTAPIA